MADKKLSLDYIAGFIDGEGCFYIHNKKNTGSWTFHINIRLRDDDKEILYEMKKSNNNIGNISIQKERKNKINNSISKPMCNYRITNKKDIDIFIKLMDGKFHAKKKRDFEVFKEAFYFYYKNSTNGKCSRKRQPNFVVESMAKYKQQLSLIKEYQSPEIEIYKENCPTIDRWM